MGRQEVINSFIEYEKERQEEIMKQYDYKGNELIIDNEGNYSDIPEKCPECHCMQGKANYKNFSNNCIHICEQCGTEIYLSYL